MITDWITRVFGRNDTHADVTMLQGDGHLLNGPPPRASIVDSDELAVELARTRRYEHDLSIAVLWTRPMHTHVPVSPDGAEAPSLATRLPQMVSLLSAVALREVLRQSDIVCYHAAENRFILGLPESDDVAARNAVARIRTHFRNRLRLRVTTGVACFPSDALTLEDLIATAETRAVLGDPASLSNGKGNGRHRVEDADDGSTHGDGARIGRAGS